MIPISNYYQLRDTPNDFDEKEHLGNHHFSVIKRRCKGS